MFNTYAKEETELFKYFLENTLFCPQNKITNYQYKTDIDIKGGIHRIELIVRPECNQKCEYCYITRHGNDLYPHSERANNEQILKNLDAFLYYIFVEKEMFIDNWELFAGDMFYDGLYFDIIDVFEKYIKAAYQKYPKVFKENPVLILTPCNFSFIEDEEKTNKLRSYIEKMREYNVDLGFSASTDGKYGVDTREQRTLSEDYFDKIFNFIKDYPRMGIHPMLSASNVRQLKDNYEWWKEMYKKHLDMKFRIPSYLEVRNDEWTDEDLDVYMDALQYMINDRLALCNNNIDELAYHLFNGDGKNGTIRRLHQNDLIRPDCNHAFKHDDRMSCSIQQMIHLTLNNLTIVPCHRLTYPHLRAGHFVLDENNRIVDIEGENPLPLMIINGVRGSDVPKCSKCVYAPTCFKGCLGAQYESTGELFMPTESVCKLLQTKTAFLLKTYEEMGVLDSARAQGLLRDSQEKAFNNILRHLKRYESDECVKCNDDMSYEGGCK